MIFSAYSDEREVINKIQRYRNEDYALLRITNTMIAKNNLDANGILRDLLGSWGLVNYEEMVHGGAHGVKHDALFVQNGKTEHVKLKFYRVSNNRGDRRFSVETIKKKANAGEINENDLLYISVFKGSDGTPQIYFMNLTHNIPGEQDIRNSIGTDGITELYESIKPKLKEIVTGGFYDNSKGSGMIDPKDVGDTLEALLGLDTNNRADADIGGKIEVKAKGGKGTLDTLFTLRPCFDGTRVANYEPKDRSRVSAFARIYGYDSDKHPGYSNLYITIGSLEAPQNHQGFYLSVDDEARIVNLMRKDPETQKNEVAAFWSFDSLKKALYDKHPSTLWFKAERKMSGNMAQFKYTEIEFSRAPQFTTFLSMIKSGAVTYDWRGYTTKEGKYSGKNHGNAWRIRPHLRSELFGEIEKVLWNTNLVDN